MPETTLFGGAMINKIKNVILIFIVCFISFCLAPGYSAEKPQGTAAQPDTAKDQILRVGVQPNSPPLIFKQDQRIVGLEADFAVALAARMGKTPLFVELQWKDMIPALLDKRIDIIMSGMSITKSRGVRIAFSDPYLIVGQNALVRGKDKTKYPDADAVKNCTVKVGVEKDTTGDLFVQQEFKYARKVNFESPDEAANALIEGKISMLIHDLPVIWLLASKKETEGVVPIPINLTKEWLAWGIRYDDPNLLKAANKFLESWKNDGRLKRVIKKWIPYA
jgi:polar amino acid transport system substrate-binding protein